MGILSIDLKKLVKDYDGKQMNFFYDEDGSKATDEEARNTIANYLAEGYDRIPMRLERLPDTTPMKENSRLKRLRDKLADLERQRIDYYRKTGQLITPRNLAIKIAQIKVEIEECEAYMPKKLSEQINRETLKKSGLASKMIKMHIAADYLTETAGVLRQALNKLGFAKCSLLPYVEAIESRASAFAGIVCHPEFAGLSGFMTTNEQLINDLDTLINLYMDKNLELN